MTTAIIGAGGHGRVVLDILGCGGRRGLVFFDNNRDLWCCDVDGVQVAGGFDILRRNRPACAVIAIGDNRVRLSYMAELDRLKVPLIRAVHENSFFSDSSIPGPGTVLAAGSVIGVHVKIGRSVIVNTGAVVDHECVLSDGCHIAPGARLAGRVSVGTGSFIGLGASVIQNIAIGDFAVVGAGSVVLSNVPAYSTVVGSPARIIKYGQKSNSGSNLADNTILHGHFVQDIK